MTVLEILQSTTGYFAKRGIESPRLNAEHLIAHGLGLKRLDVYLAFERQLTETELVPLRDLVRRRGQNEPLQHLLGTVEFCGNIFRCDDRALVPRPETEELVELVIADCETRNAKKILDVGTGSGVIALSLALKLSSVEIDAIDISPAALGLARENAERWQLPRVRFLESDLMTSVNDVYDVIVANLPYVAREDRAQLAPEVLRDPEMALFGGERGDELIRRLIEEAPPRLAPGGLLALEIGLGQSDALSLCLREKNFHDILAKEDYAGMTRFLFARYG